MKSHTAKHHLWSNTRSQLNVIIKQTVQQTIPATYTVSQPTSFASGHVCELPPTGPMVWAPHAVTHPITTLYLLTGLIEARLLCQCVGDNTILLLFNGRGSLFSTSSG